VTTHVIGAGFLIYHPRRLVTEGSGGRIYHDKLKGNQDPYIWNKQFLHTYCHMAQMSPKVGDTCFWVWGPGWPTFSALFCDLIFVVISKEYWTQANSISRADTIVDSDEAFNDHYQWGNWEHQYRRRRRFTLKADPNLSFQPQAAGGALLDIAPVLASVGLTLSSLREGLVLKRRASQPMRITPVVVAALYQWLAENAVVQLKGSELQAFRRKNPQLASPPRSKASSCGRQRKC
jgi:hypothetical protein